MNTKSLRSMQAQEIRNKIDHTKLVARDAMIEAVLLYEDDKIELIVEKLRNEDTNYVLVIDKKGKFIGEISINKLIKIIAHTSISEPLVKHLDTGYHRGINFTTAKDHLTKHKNIVKEDEPILNILELIDKKGSNYIPVSNNQGKIIGLITPSSLLDLISKH